MAPTSSRTCSPPVLVGSHDALMPGEAAPAPDLTAVCGFSWRCSGATQVSISEHGCYRRSLWLRSTDQPRICWHAGGRQHRCQRREAVAQLSVQLLLHAAGDSAAGGTGGALS
jgi:hypothetical protein